MAFRLLYNNLFPLRMVNLIKKYTDTVGNIQIGNKIAGQLSKLQLIDFFFPSLFIRELPADREEAEYDFETCFILAPRKHGVLSNWGPSKQKINEIEDCMLGNSRNEATYKNYTAAHSMLRRASADLQSDESAFDVLISNLRSIYNRMDENQKQEYSHFMKELLEHSREDEKVRFCTASRMDGFSFEKSLYERLLEDTEKLYAAQEYASCFAWLCIGSVFGNYSKQLMNKYFDGYALKAGVHSDPQSPSLISSPSVIAKPGFCGRDRELRKIDDLFEAGNRVVFLSGIGGIGKTEIAKQYTAISRKKYDVIVYAVYDRSIKELVIADIPFETVPAIPRLMNDSVRESDDDYFRRKLSLIKRTSDERTLIILDNFNTEKDENLNEFLSGRYRVLITTQYDYSKEFAAVKVQEINDMESLVNIFMNHYQGYAVERNDPDLIRLFQAVSCHTYTVVLLAHHMENSGQTAAQMLGELQQKGIVSLNDNISVREGDGDIAWQNLFCMFSISEFSDEERKILQLLSLISSGAVPAMEFMRWADLPSTKNILALERRGWIMRSEGGILLHPVVHSVVQTCLDPVETEIKSFLDHFAEFISEKNSWHFTKLQKEQASMICRNIMKSFETINEDTVEFYEAAASLYGYSGDPERAVELGKMLYEYNCQRDGMYSFRTGRAAYRIGWVYLFNPQMDRSLDYALEWLLRTNEIFEHIPKETVDEQAVYCGVLENISKAYSVRFDVTGAKRDISEALRYAKKAVSLSRVWLQDYMVTKRSPAGNLLRLADVDMVLMEYEQAEELIDEAYEILTAMYGTADPDVLRASSRKAKVLFHLGRYKQALEETEKNLVSYRRFYGLDNPSLFDQMILKIRCCRKLGLTEAAEQTEKEALETGEKIYLPDSRKLRALKAGIIEEL